MSFPVFHPPVRTVFPLISEWGQDPILRTPACSLTSEYVARLGCVTTLFWEGMPRDMDVPGPRPTVLVDQNWRESHCRDRNQDVRKGRGTAKLRNKLPLSSGAGSPPTSHLPPLPTLAPLHRVGTHPPASESQPGPPGRSRAAPEAHCQLRPQLS